MQDQLNRLEEKLDGLDVDERRRLQVIEATLEVKERVKERERDEAGAIRKENERTKKDIGADA